MKKIRWGVISTAKIGVDEVIPPMQKLENCEIVAIGSRDLGRAQQAAEQLGIPRAYGSYDAVIADPDVDAIYNPLPNHLHVSVSIQALEAGKHVLCEKPIAMTSEEGQQLVDAGKRFPHLKLMEAFMYRHHPQWKKAVELVSAEEFGDVLTINTVFSYYNVDGNNIRNRLDAGGGGLMDIGCYPISLSRLIYGGPPERVFGIVEYDPNFGTDRKASAILDFGRGTSTFSVSTQMVPYQRVNIYSANGRVEIEIPFNPPVDRPTKMWRQNGREVEEIEIPISDQFGIQGETFSRCILEDLPVPTPIEDAVVNMKVIEAVKRSGKSGTWEKV